MGSEQRVPGPPPIPRCEVCGGGSGMALHKASCPHGVQEQVGQRPFNAHETRLAESERTVAMLRAAASEARHALTRQVDIIETWKKDATGNYIIVHQTTADAFEEHKAAVASLAAALESSGPAAAEWERQTRVAAIEDAINELRCAGFRKHCSVEYWDAMEAGLRKLAGPPAPSVTKES